MFWIWFLLATSQCALLYILARRGESMPRRIEEEAEANRAIPEDKWPSVGMIVPVAGRDPRMEGALITPVLSPCSLLRKKMNPPPSL